MKERPILITAIILSLIVEFIIILLVFNKIGSERLPAQSIRLFIEIVLISLIVIKKSNKALLVLAGLHIFTGLLQWGTIHSSGIVGQILSIYHFVIALLIYFHDYLENILLRKKV
jgi:hypothetical protein